MHGAKKLDIYLQIATVDPRESVPELFATQPFHSWWLNQFHSEKSTDQNVYESTHLIDWRLHKCHWRFLPRHMNQIHSMTPEVGLIRSDETCIFTTSTYNLNSQIKDLISNPQAAHDYSYLSWNIMKGKSTEIRSPLKSQKPCSTSCLLFCPLSALRAAPPGTGHWALSGARTNRELTLRDAISIHTPPPDNNN